MLDARDVAYPVVVARMSGILSLSERKACVERYGEDKDKSRGF